MQQVSTLVIAIFTHKLAIAIYDQEAGNVLANHDGFEMHHDILNETKPKEDPFPYTTNNAGNPIRYIVERSEAFGR